MRFEGYLALSPDGETYSEVINACRTIAYIGQRFKSHTHGPEYTYPDHHWQIPKSSICEAACSPCVVAAEEYTYPADPMNPAPWYDANVAASEEFFGMMPSEFIITKGVGPRQPRSASSGRVSGRLKRTATIRGPLVANSCAGTSYGLEWLNATLVAPANTAGGCQSGACGASVEVWRPDCECDPEASARASGQRFLHGVTGFDVLETELDPSGNCIPCCEGVWVEITFEIENTRAWLPVENIDTIDTSVTDATCVENIHDDSCETEEIEVTRNRVSRPVRVQKNGKLCPIGWELNDWDEDTDRLVLAEFEQVPAQADAFGYLLSLRQDPVTLDIDVYDVITDAVFDETEWECGTPAEIVELQYANPDYQPLCLDCPGAYEDCATLHSIILDVDGYVDWVSTGIDTDTWYLYDPDTTSTGTDAEATQLGDYWDCINLQVPNTSTKMDAPNVGLLDQILQSAKDSYTAEFAEPYGSTNPPVRLVIRVGTNSGGLGDTIISAQPASGAPGAGEPVNITYRIVMPNWPGWNRSIYEDDAICGEQTTIPDYCKPVLIDRLNPGKPFAVRAVIDNGETPF